MIQEVLKPCVYATIFPTHVDFINDFRLPHELCVSVCARRMAGRSPFPKHRIAASEVTRKILGSDNLVLKCASNTCGRTRRRTEVDGKTIGGNDQAEAEEPKLNER